MVLKNHSTCHFLSIFLFKVFKSVYPSSKNKINLRFFQKALKSELHIIIDNTVIENQSNFFLTTKLIIKKFIRVRKMNRSRLILHNYKEDRLKFDRLPIQSFLVNDDSKVTNVLMLPISHHKFSSIQNRHQYWQRTVNTWIMK